MIKIDGNDAIALMERAVEEKGENHVVACAYTDGVEGICIVGKVLEYVGAPLGSILNSRQNPDDDPAHIVSVNSSRVASVDWTEFGVQVTPVALKLFDTAQKTQDRGDTWGEALNEAKTAHQKMESFV